MNYVPIFEHQEISHKNLDFWLPWKTKRYANPGPTFLPGKNWLELVAASSFRWDMGSLVCHSPPYSLMSNTGLPLLICFTFLAPVGI